MTQTKQTTIGQGTSEAGVLPRENHAVDLLLRREPPQKSVASNKSHIFAHSSPNWPGFGWTALLCPMWSWLGGSPGLEDLRWLHAHAWSSSQSGWLEWPGMTGLVSLLMASLSSRVDGLLYTVSQRAPKRVKIQVSTLHKAWCNIVSVPFFWTKQVTRSSQI